MKMNGTKLFMSKEDVEMTILAWLKETKYSDCKLGSIEIKSGQRMEAKHTRGGVTITFLKDEKSPITIIDKTLEKAGIKIP